MEPPHLGIKPLLHSGLYKYYFFKLNNKGCPKGTDIRQLEKLEEHLYPLFVMLREH